MTTQLRLDLSSPEALAASFWQQREGLRSTPMRCDCRAKQRGRELRLWGATFILHTGGTLLWIAADSEGPAVAYLLTTDPPATVTYPYGEPIQIRAPQCGCSWFLSVDKGANGDVEINARRATSYTRTVVAE